MRIMVTGRRRRGKDTMGDIVKELVPGITHGAFAAELKRELRDLLILTWKDEYGVLGQAFYHEDLVPALDDRFLMGPGWQWYGELARRINPDYWVQQFHARYGVVPDLVVTDMRHHNEAKYGKEHGFLLVRVEGPYRGPKEDNRSDTHPSEIHVDELPVNLTYSNQGSLEDMREWVEGILVPLAKRSYAEADATFYASLAGRRA